MAMMVGGCGGCATSECGCGGFFFPLLLFVVVVDLAGGGGGGWMWWLSYMLISPH